MIIIALLILCACAQNSITYDLPQTETMPYHKQTSYQTAYSNNNDQTNRWNGNEGLTEEQRQQIMESVFIGYCIGVILALSFSLFLCFRCIQKRRRSESVKSQMRVQRQSYATGLGINLYQL